jgi:nucleotide-binding universal stress UspA family protein
MNDDFRILVAIDLKAGTDRLIGEAERYVRAFNAAVDIIHIAPPDPAFVGYLKHGESGDEAGRLDPRREPTATALRSEHHETQEIGEALRAKGVRVDRVLTIQGPTLAAILEQAEKSAADLLILGSHHHGALYRLWYGETAAEAVEKAPCALLVVPLD